MQAMSNIKIQFVLPLIPRMFMSIKGERGD